MPPELGDVEPIPGDDQVSRIYFNLPERQPPETTHFQFPYDKDRDERAESVYWRRYAVQVPDVHARGCALQTKWAEASGLKYEGCRTAVVDRIRSIVTERGHRFQVIHYPQLGDNAHAHVLVDRKGGNVKKLSPNDRVELTRLLIECFEDPQPHTCP